jgi:hypothetical protein
MTDEHPIGALLRAIRAEPTVIEAMNEAAATADAGDPDGSVALLRLAAVVIVTEHPDLGPAGAVQLVLSSIVGRMRARRETFRGDRLN